MNYLFLLIFLSQNINAQPIYPSALDGYKGTETEAPNNSNLLGTWKSKFTADRWDAHQKDLVLKFSMQNPENGLELNLVEKDKNDFSREAAVTNIKFVNVEYTKFSGMNGDFTNEDGSIIRRSLDSPIVAGGTSLQNCKVILILKSPVYLLCNTYIGRSSMDDQTTIFINHENYNKVFVRIVKARATLERLDQGGKANSEESHDLQNVVSDSLFALELSFDTFENVMQPN